MGARALGPDAKGSADVEPHDRATARADRVHGERGKANRQAADGALVLTLIITLLTTLQLPESTRQIVYGLTLLALLSAYGRQRGLRQ